MAVSNEEISADGSEGSSKEELYSEDLFQEFRTEVDAKHDLYEKLVKKSRDITIESKRIIFLLHRYTTDEKKEKILIEAKKRLKDTYTALTVGIGSLLVSQDMFQYLRAFTGGIQEFVEAVSFYYYLKFGKLVSMQEVCSAEFLFDKDVEADKSDSVKKIPMSELLTEMDYILGIADLTGELMRKCIASGSLEEPFELLSVLKNVNDAFLYMGNCCGREVPRKASTLKASLQKVENACFTLRVRGSETEKLLSENKELSKIISLSDVFNSGDDVQCE